jgi:hypothetical protein
MLMNWSVLMKTVKVKMPNVPSCSCSGNNSSNCCTQRLSYDDNWVTGRVTTSIGEILQVSTTLDFCDTLGTLKARFGINRMKYTIDPGLYCVGNPDNTSPVLVTANYKMSFDSLRKELADINAWILVLDTKGINVWCAAGKGTFGTKELVNRINKVKLSSVVSHRNIILPQLGAPGIIAHEVQRLSGFKITFGPVRASDVKAFISSGMKADTEMRIVKFTFLDRLVLTPMELVTALKYSIVVFGVLFILNSIGFGQYGFIELYAFLGAIFVGSTLTPLLLPWIPGRAFAFKGFILGLLWIIAVNFLNGWPDIPSYGLLKTIAYILILPNISAFLAMNFTGCSTYTSLSGVKREMKIAVPVMIISAGVGIILLIIDSFIKIFN